MEGQKDKFVIYISLPLFRLKLLINIYNINRKRGKGKSITKSKDGG